MALLNAQQIKEVNQVIAEIDKVIKPNYEIGAHDRPALNALLKTQNLKKEVIFFACKRELSETIVMHFVKEKGVAKNRFHKNNQAFIFVVK
jgi:hypothetical protein